MVCSYMLLSKSKCNICTSQCTTSSRAKEVGDFLQKQTIHIFKGILHRDWRTSFACARWNLRQAAKSPRVIAWENEYWGRSIRDRVIVCSGANESMNISKNVLGLRKSGCRHNKLCLTYSADTLRPAPVTRDIRKAAMKLERAICAGIPQTLHDCRAISCGLP
jgi:hypothetical protein